MSVVYEAFLRRYKDYTDIQKVAMPMVASGSNCLIIAPTGAGKTEAAVLPLLDAIGKAEDKQVLHCLFAEIMVDAIGLRLIEKFAQV